MKQQRQKAFTLLELLVAMTMLSMITLVVSVTIGQIYLNQKKIVLRQGFHDEARLLMERVVQLVRNNTVDYDRYFIDYGPDIMGTGACVSFSSDQVPTGTTASQRNNNPTGNLAGYQIGKQNRAALGYESVFYWNTNGDGDQDRTLGGKLPDNDVDPCLAAFQPTELDTFNSGTLYLINAKRTNRTAIVVDDKGTGADTTDDELTIERQYAIDTDGDQRGDVWSSDASWDGGSSKCEIRHNSTDYPVLGQPNDPIDAQKFCLNAHSAENILPRTIEVKRASFIPAPNQDPFLAFRIDESQIHPHVYIDFQLEMKNPTQYGFSPNTLPPNTRLRTAASSRVFGDNRK